MTSRSRSGAKTVTDSESEPSEVRGQPSFFCTFLGRLACCRPRKDVTTGFKRNRRTSRQ
jgi:hypothetical protein